MRLIVFAWREYPSGGMNDIRLDYDGEIREFSSLESVDEMIISLERVSDVYDTYQIVNRKTLEAIEEYSIINDNKHKMMVSNMYNKPKRKIC